MPTTSRPRDRSLRTGAVLGALAIVLALLATLIPTSPASAAPPERDGPSTAINWRPCYKKFDDFQPGPISFECAVVPVPLDYDNPAGGVIQLSVVRIPAWDQENKIGSLFTNPGGPGGSDVEFTLFSAPFIYSPDIRQNFDIVGFDPRGVLLSTPARCYGNYRQATFAPMAYPATDADVGTWLDADRDLQDACAQRGSKVLDHMSTANVARDMDRLREAVGDEQLTYIGYSYGTVLGATYANMFPDRVRAIALDSALDPAKWTTGEGDGDTVPLTARINSHVGAQDSLEHFFAACDASPDVCPLAPDSQARFDELYDRLKTDPITIREVFVDPETGEEIVFEFTITLDQVIATVLGILYTSDFWVQIAYFVHFVEMLADGPAPPPGLAVNVAAFMNGDTEALSRAAQPWPATVDDATWQALASLTHDYATKVGPPRYVNFLEATPGVMCADSDNPADIGAWPATAAALEAEGYYFGPIWTWRSSICHGWPGVDADRYTGPWDHETANPVLILTNEFDPATPYGEAVALHDRLASSHLLVVDGGRGHIAAQASQCAAIATEQYVLHLALPPAGTTCEPNQLPVIAVPQPPPIEVFESVTIEGPDGQPLTLDSLYVGDELIQPVLVVTASDGSLQVVEPVVVGLGTGSVAVVDTPDGPIELHPLDIVDESGTEVSVEARVYPNALIVDAVPLGPPPPPPPPEGP